MIDQINTFKITKKSSDPINTFKLEKKSNQSTLASLNGGVSKKHSQ